MPLARRLALFAPLAAVASAVGRAGLARTHVSAQADNLTCDDEVKPIAEWAGGDVSERESPGFVAPTLERHFKPQDGKGRREVLVPQCVKQIFQDGDFIFDGVWRRNQTCRITTTNIISKQVEEDEFPPVDLWEFDKLFNGFTEQALRKAFVEKRERVATETKPRWKYWSEFPSNVWESFKSSAVFGLWPLAWWP